MSINDDPEPHPTQADCVNDEAFIDEVTDEKTVGELHLQTVECPVCGRRYTYVYEHEGLFNPDEGMYVQWSERAKQQSRMIEAHGADPLRDNLAATVELGDYTVHESEAYYSGQTYSVPITSEWGDRYERVYILQSLQDESGDTLYSF